MLFFQYYSIIMINKQLCTAAVMVHTYYFYFSTTCLRVSFAAALGLTPRSLFSSALFCALEHKPSSETYNTLYLACLRRDELNIIH